LNSYLTDGQKARMAWLLGCLACHATTAYDAEGSDANDRAVAWVEELRKLLLPEPPKPRDDPAE
jgi:hypothetical protein